MKTKNPWEEIRLEDYENHMSWSGARQLQAMNRLMADQFSRYPASSAMVLGVAGGNGLEHVDRDKYERVYGVDINSGYLKECVRRFPQLENVFIPLHSDLLKDADTLPHADLVIANLLVEYIGFDCFRRTLQAVRPEYVSSAIQVNAGDSFVSSSPYLHAFDRLGEILHKITGADLIASLREMGYAPVFEETVKLPNGKALLRTDFQDLSGMTSTTKSRGSLS